MNEASPLGGLNRTFETGRTRPIEWRRAQLRGLQSMVAEQEESILKALAEDLGKPAQEGFAELAIVGGEVAHSLKHLRSRMKPRRVRTPMVGQPGRSWIQPEPVGTVLIIGAWNYPFQLLMAPLVTALSAGNCALLKPSELAPATAALIAELVPGYLDVEAVAVVQGGVEETTGLLRERFDHIVFTGSSHVGRIVMRAAAEHLTPVTLELGGKSPAVVDAGADLVSAARRIVWGKCLNAGQTCIAPDYVLVDTAHRDALVDEIGKVLGQWYGDDPDKVGDYARIINDRHYERLVSHLSEGRVAIGGGVDAGRRFIEPTVLVDVAPDSPVMTEEIFGPILPVITTESLGESLDFVARRDKPLAAYLFSRNTGSHNRFVERISAGSICINDTLMFMTVPDLPFGGIGPSGMGQYKGRAGFDRLSHLKAVMKRGRWPEVSIRFPPYNRIKMRLLRMLG